MSRTESWQRKIAAQEVDGSRAPLPSSTMSLASQRPEARTHAVLLACSRQAFSDGKAGQISLLSAKGMAWSDRMFILLYLMWPTGITECPTGGQLVQEELRAGRLSERLLKTFL